MIFRPFAHPHKLLISLNLEPLAHLVLISCVKVTNPSPAEAYGDHPSFHPSLDFHVTFPPTAQMISIGKMRKGIGSPTFVTSNSRCSVDKGLERLNRCRKELPSPLACLTRPLISASTCCYLCH